MTNRRLQVVTGYIFLAPYVASFFTFIVLPIVVSFALAFMQLDLTAAHSTKFVGGGNFSEAWHDDYFWRSLKATMLYAAMIVPSLLVTGMALALGMNAMSRGRDIVRAFIFLPGLLNVAVTGILWAWFYNGEFGLFNFVLKGLHREPIPWLSERSHAMPSIAIMSLWWTVGGTSIVLLTALQQIPRELFEAAALDGAGSKTLFSKITLPQLKPVMQFVVITSTIGGFQMFGQAFMLTRGGPELATRGLVQYIYETAFNNYRLGYGATMSWMLFAVIAVFSLVQLHFMRRSAG